MDIGTRSVIGIVAETNEAGNLEIIATTRQEHKTRAMLDGQIHDVPQVAAVIRDVKDALVKKTGPITSAAVAAAGRALYTMTAEAEQEVNGIISASRAMHRVEKVFKDNCEELGEVINTAQPVVNNGVIVTLKNGSVWNVAGTSYLSSLTIEEGSSLVGTLTVNGKDVEAAPGVYTGAITVTI